MGVLKKVTGRAAKALVKKVAVTNTEGETEIKTVPTQGVKKLGWIVAALLLWHFLLQPLLSHFFPGADFPTLDGGWIGTVIMGL